MNDITVVVGTLDLYRDVWPGLCHGLKKYWSDCPWPVVFITNKLDAPRGYGTIKVGGDRTRWSDRIKRGLKRVATPIILWMVSDHWITAEPGRGALAAFAKLMRDGKADRIRLYPGWDHDRGHKTKLDSRLLAFDKDSPYRTSCKPSFWMRGVFLDLLRSGESPWQFECNGPERSRRYGDRFLAVKGWGIWHIVTKGDPTGPWAKSPVVKGKWTTAAKRYCKLEGLNIDLSKHPVKGNPFGKEVPSWVLP